VADDIVEAVLAEAFPTDESVETMVVRLAEKRARQLGPLPRSAKRRRLLAYLARRGFTGHEVLATVERLTGGDVPRGLASIRG
jgi:SOS response regulatory protein OraA/RecX